MRDLSEHTLYAICEGGVVSIQIDKDDQFTLYQVENRVTHITIDPTGKYLAIRNTRPYLRSFSGKGYGSEVSLLEVKSGERINLASSTSSTNYPTTICFSMNMNLVYIGRYNGSVQIFDTSGKRGRPRRAFRDISVTAISAGLDGIICGSGAGEIVFLDHRLRVKHPFLHEKYSNKILQIETNLPTGKLAVLSASGKIDVWNQERAKILEISHPVDELKLISFDPAGAYLATSAGGTIYIFDVNPSSPSFGGCIHTLGQAVNCSGMFIDGAKGLEASAPSGKGTLKAWLQDRGAT